MLQVFYPLYPVVVQLQLHKALQAPQVADFRQVLEAERCLLDQLVWQLPLLVLCKLWAAGSHLQVVQGVLVDSNQLRVGWMLLQLAHTTGPQQQQLINPFCLLLLSTLTTMHSRISSSVTTPASVSAIKRSKLTGIVIE